MHNNFFKVSFFLITLIMSTTLSAQQLTDRQKALAVCASLEAQGDLTRLQPAIIDALDRGVTVNELKEAFSQLYAYTGFPRSLNALGVLQKVLSSPNAKWQEGKPWIRPALWNDAREALAFGTEMQTRLSGQPFDYEFCPQNNYYLKSHLFGDIFAGDQLSPADRELVTVAALASLKGVEPQLAAHQRGAVNMGNSPEAVDELMQSARSLAGGLCRRCKGWQLASRKPQHRLCTILYRQQLPGTAHSCQFVSGRRGSFAPHQRHL